MGIEELQDKAHLMDVFDLMKKLPDGSVDCVYSEPDYGISYAYGKNRDIKYLSDWNKYIDWYIALAKESLRVLKPNGNIFFLNYPKQNAYLQVKFLEDACYAVHEYVWVTGSSMRKSPYHFTIAHRSILHGRKSERSVWYKDQVAYRSKNKKDGKFTEAMPLSWIFANVVGGMSREKTFHSCQINTKIVDLLFKAATKENDLILIHFAGSGGECAVANHLGRHFIAADLNKDYVDLTNDRISKGFIQDKYRLRTNLKGSFAFKDERTSGKLCPGCGNPLSEGEELCDACSEKTIVNLYKGDDR